MTTAIIDRITHKAMVINMNGNSYRLKETQAWLQQKNQFFILCLRGQN